MHCKQVVSSAIACLAAAQTPLSPRLPPTSEPLQPFIHDRFMYSQTVHACHRSRPTGVAEGASPQPHRGFRAVILARSKTFTLNVLYRQVLFLLKTHF